MLKIFFVYIWLMYSLEVFVVGWFLGRVVGKVILEKYFFLEKIYGYCFNDFGVIVVVVFFVYDIGNLLFGYLGEKVIGDYFLNGNGSRFKKEFIDK